jgi:hypothetical protein
VEAFDVVQHIHLSMGACLVNARLTRSSFNETKKTSMAVWPVRLPAAYAADQIVAFEEMLAPVESKIIVIPPS